MTNEVLSRFLSHVNVTPNCWLWTGALYDGYGHFHLGSRTFIVHRLSFEHYVGTIKEGNEIDHLCKVRNCVNPSHLESVTTKVNSERSSSPIAANAKKTQCLNGHPFDGDNTYRRGDKRQCRECGRTRSREFARRKRFSTNSLGSQADEKQGESNVIAGASKAGA